MKSTSDPTHVAAILAALANGDHPFTGMPLPSEHILRDSRVLAALAAAAAQLDPTMQLDQLTWTEAAEPAAPSRMGQAWTAEETTLLVAGFDAERSNKDLAAELGRTRGAVRSRLVHLGLIHVETTKGNTRFLKDFEAGTLLPRCIPEATDRARRLLQASDPDAAEARLQEALARYPTVTLRT